jgi:hypothetical protein
VTHHLYGSANRGAIYIGLVNASPNDGANVELAVDGSGGKRVSGQVHRAEDGFTQRLRGAGAGAASGIYRRSLDGQQAARRHAAKVDCGPDNPIRRPAQAWPGRPFGTPIGEA